MVTIKIQSRGDIIGAYLQTLGFGREKAAEVSDGLSGMICLLYTSDAADE